MMTGHLMLAQNLYRLAVDDHTVANYHLINLRANTTTKRAIMKAPIKASAMANPLEYL